MVVEQVTINDHRALDEYSMEQVTDRVAELAFDSLNRELTDDEQMLIDLRQHVSALETRLENYARFKLAIDKFEKILEGLDAKDTVTAGDVRSMLSIVTQEALAAGLDNNTSTD